MLVYFTSFTVCSGDIKKAKKALKMNKKKSSEKKEKKKALKMTSQAFFSSPDPKSEKNFP